MEALKEKYNDIVITEFGGNFLNALKSFDELSENNLRNILKKTYAEQRSRDQAWKTCKGSLYEYAVFKYIHSIIENNDELNNKVKIIMGDKGLISYKDQIVIRNWCDILPDVDILLIQREFDKVIAILSCKTSLRERLTETAFWKRELEKTRKTKINLIFITTDKDNELRTETNRYILLHVIDYTFITDPYKYDELINSYKNRYGVRKDFGKLLKRIKFIDEFESFIYSLLKSKGE